MSPKFCKDCRFCEVTDTGFKAARCTFVMSTRVDLVSGEAAPVHQKYEFCGTLRQPALEGEEVCGEEGRFWQSKDVPA